MKITTKQIVNLIKMGYTRSQVARALRVTPSNITTRLKRLEAKEKQ